MEIEGEKYLQRPGPLKAPPEKRDKQKYCRFYSDHGHDIEECRQLWDEIKILVHRDYLDKYVRPTKIEEYKPPAEGTSDDHNRSTADVINMISDVLSNTDDLSLKKQRIEDIILFTKNDVKGIQISQNDVVVVSMMIVKYDVKRVLIDNESSTDVLFYDVFSKMNLVG